MTETDAFLLGEATSTAFFPTGYVLLTPAISFISTAFVTLVSVAFKLHKSSLGIMILSFNLSDLVYAFLKLTGTFIPVNDDASCIALLFIGNVAWMASLLWGAVFAHALLMAVKHKGLDVLQKLIRWYVILSIVIPLLVSVAFLFYPYVQYDPTSKKCIFAPGTTQYLALFITFSVLLSSILSIYWYIQAARKLKNVNFQTSIRNLVLLMVFSLISVICWLPWIIVLLIDFKNNPDAQPSNSQKILHSFAYLNGFFNALVYGRSANMIGLIYQKCKKRNSAIVTIEQEEEESPGNSRAKSEMSFISELKGDAFTEPLIVRESRD